MIRYRINSPPLSEDLTEGSTEAKKKESHKNEVWRTKDWEKTEMQGVGKEYNKVPE